ncbi:MAG: threonine dehydratase [Candidatus Azotimanducaceae bacterium]
MVPLSTALQKLSMHTWHQRLKCVAQALQQAGVISATRGNHGQSVAYADSFVARNVISAPVTTRLADGMACSTPELSALEMMWAGVSRMVKVTDDEIAAAMQMMFECTHNTSEGAGAGEVTGSECINFDQSQPPAPIIMLGSHVLRYACQIDQLRPGERWRHRGDRRKWRACRQ